MAPGALSPFGHSREMERDLLGFFERLRGLGPVVRIRLDQTSTYVLNDAELVRRVQVEGNGTEFDKGGPMLAAFVELTGDGIVNLTAGPHRPVRALVRPAFQRCRLPVYGERIRECATELARTWRSGQVIDADEEMTRLVVAVLARTLFLSAGSENAVEVFQRNFPHILSGLAARMVAPTSKRLPIPVMRLYDRAVSETRSVITELVRDRVADPVDYGDLLSLLVPPGRTPAMSEQNIYEQILSFFFGGVDTTASLLGWVLCLLAGDPVQYDCLVAEFDRELGRRDPVVDDLARLPFLRRVLTEALRLYPPAWLLSRVALVDTELGGYSVPAGTGVFYSPYVIQRNPDVFADPNRFDPDRWLPERVTRAQREAYIPFGLGARRCLGEAFGLVEASMVLAVVLRRWRIRIAPGNPATPKVGTTLHPQHARLVLTPRT